MVLVVLVVLVVVELLAVLEKLPLVLVWTFALVLVSEPVQVATAALVAVGFVLVLEVPALFV